MKISSSHQRFKNYLCRLSGNDPYEDVKKICDQPQEDLAKYGCNPNMKLKIFNQPFIFMATH
jgi:hypothetical protein